MLWSHKASRAVPRWGWSPDHGKLVHTAGRRHHPQTLLRDICTTRIRCVLPPSHPHSNFLFSTFTMLTLSQLIVWPGLSLLTCCDASDVILLDLQCSWRWVLRNCWVSPRSWILSTTITFLTLNVIDWAYHFPLHHLTMPKYVGWLEVGRYVVAL